MIIIFYVFIFIVSVLLLYFSSERLVKSLTKIAQFLGWREFIFALFIMAFASSLPNFFIGINSAIQGVPKLSLGEIFGGNLFDLTVVIALAAIISKNGLAVRGRTVRATAIFTLIVASLPILLIHDLVLSRLDGVILIFSFMAYVFWLFSKEERFTRIYDEKEKTINIKDILKTGGVLLGSFILIILAAQGIVKSSIFFAESLNLPLILIGILIVGLSAALPETFFSIHAAKKGDDWMIIGGVMGAVISCSTLVLGMVAILYPIELTTLDASFLSVARIFLIVAALISLLFITTGRKIDTKEGIFLLIIYLLFVLIQILVV